LDCILFSVNYTAIRTKRDIRCQVDFVKKVASKRRARGGLSARRFKRRRRSRFARIDRGRAPRQGRRLDDDGIRRVRRNQTQRRTRRRERRLTWTTRIARRSRRRFVRRECERFGALYRGCSFWGRCRPCRSARRIRRHRRMGTCSDRSRQTHPGVRSSTTRSTSASCRRCIGCPSCHRPCGAVGTSSGRPCSERSWRCTSRRRG
jgi:hypothetical protein